MPPSWDSWGKIRVIREGFDVEGTSSGWSVDIRASASAATNGDSETANAEINSSKGSEGAVLPTYESTVLKPHTYLSSKPKTPGIDVTIPTSQTFLTKQLEILEKLKLDDEAAAASSKREPNSSSYSNTATRLHEERVNEHIGPVQVNMGGIQVDADDMLKKLRSRKEGAEGTSRTPEVHTTEKTIKSLDEMKAENEGLTSFFESLLKKETGASPRGTPGRRDASRESSGTPSRKTVARD